MSTRGVDFMHRWVDTHISLSLHLSGDPGIRTRLAQQCVADAQAEGIARHEIEEEIGGIEQVIGFALEDTVEGRSRDD